MNLEVQVLASALWGRGGDAWVPAPGILDPLPERLSFHPAPDPSRPAAIDAGTWRRLSRIGRLAAAVAVPVLLSPAAAYLDRDTLFVAFGTGIGEFSSSVAFLRSLHQRGPAGASPLSFQTSVHNAAPGQLAIALGMRGPMETLCAGERTAGQALVRGALHALGGGGPALVILADDLGPDVQVGLRYGGHLKPYSEGAAAFLLGAEPGGQRLRLHVGGPSGGPGDGARRFGAFPTVPAVALVAQLRAGAGSVVLGGGVSADVTP